MTLVLILPLLVLLALSLESYLHRRWLEKIPMRISVNGSRGKSSVTKYIRVGLSGAGINAMAKITGVDPVEICSDGSTNKVRRWGPPRVQEQLRLVYHAARQKVSALVAECMAVKPELQMVDARIIQPHVYVITNILADHGEQFPGGADEYCEAVCAALPQNGQIVTANSPYLPRFEAVARLRGSQVHVVDDCEFAEVAGDGFPLNPALALKVCEFTGVKRELARSAIEKEFSSAPSPVEIIDTATGCVCMVDGLAVNDIESATAFRDRWRSTETEHEIFLLHTRGDRPQRTRQFVRWIATLGKIDHVILSGDSIGPARRLLNRQGVESSSTIPWYRQRIISNVLLESGNTTIFAFGNTGSGGRQIWDRLKLLVAQGS